MIPAAFERSRRVVKWMFGEWSVRSTFTRVATPLGKRLVPDAFLDIDGATNLNAQPNRSGTVLSFPSNPQISITFIRSAFMQ